MKKPRHRKMQKLPRSHSDSKGCWNSKPPRCLSGRHWDFTVHGVKQKKRNVSLLPPHFLIYVILPCFKYPCKSPEILLCHGINKQCREWYPAQEDKVKILPQGRGWIQPVLQWSGFISLGCSELPSLEELPWVAISQGGWGRQSSKQTELGQTSPEAPS